MEWNEMNYSTRPHYIRRRGFLGVESGKASSGMYISLSEVLGLVVAIAVAVGDEMNARSEDIRSVIQSLYPPNTHSHLNPRHTFSIPLISNM